MKRIARIILIIIFIAALILGGLVVYKLKQSGQESKYKTELIKNGDVVQTVSANGTLNPVILVTVGAQVTGMVQKIYADFNDHVKEGQVLLELDRKLLQANLAQSSASVKKAEAALTLAIANEKRGAPLRKDNFISKQDWEQLIEARSVAAADLELAKATLQKDQTNVNYATIISPVSGTIVDRQVDVGQTVTAGFQTPVLYKIAQDLSKMQIDSSYAEADIGNIRESQEVNFTVDAFPERKFSGIVKQIRLNPTTQQNVVTYNVVVTVDNPEQILLPGMTAYVNIKTQAHKNVLLVPNTALRYRLKKAPEKKEIPGYGTVYKLVNDKPVGIICRLAITDNKYTEIASGNIKVGDMVVIGDAEKDQATSTASGFRVRVF